MRVCIIFNPTARGDKARRFLKYLDSQRKHCALKPTFAAGAARLLATEAVREGYDTVVAAGGDGTVNEVLNGIGDAPEGFKRARLGVLPIGTVNVFARDLAIPLKVPSAWETILKGRETLIDVPRIQFSSADTPPRYFAQMAGFGWDARAIELVSWELKKRFGQIAYMIAGWQALKEKAPCISVIHNEKISTGAFVLVGNGRFYGGAIPVFHQADFRDGLLDVCVFPKINWFVLARYAFGFFARRMLSSGPEKYFQASSIRIESGTSTPLELDGEMVGYLPATCSVERETLRVVVP